MIKAEIKMVDGDIITLMFESWPSLALWMEDHMGQYSSVDAKPTMEG